MEEEEKDSPDYIGHFVRFIILGWSLSVMTLGYMEKIRLDTWLWYARFYKSRSLSSKAIFSHYLTDFSVTSAFTTKVIL